MHNSHFTPGRDHRGGWEEGLQEMRRGMVGQWWKKGIPARGIDSTPPSMFTALLRIPANVKEEETRGEGDGRGTCNVAPLCIQERLIYKHSCSLSWLHNESNKPGCTEQFPKKKQKKKRLITIQVLLILLFNTDSPPQRKNGRRRRRERLWCFSPEG